MSVSVQEYLDRHKLSIRIEEAVNAAVRAQSDDPVAFIANHLRKHSVSVITKVRARQVLDARGIPTIEAEVQTNRGSYTAIAASEPSGSIYTAAELRDGASSSLFGRWGVTKAVASVSSVLAPLLVGKDPREQADLDKTLATELEHSCDTPKLIGANAVRAVSLAISKAGAAEKDMHLFEHISDIAGLPMYSLPAPMFGLLHGGPSVPNGLPFREILCMPLGVNSFAEATRIGSEVSHALVDTVREAMGEEAVRFSEVGEFIPPVSSVQDALGLISRAAERAGHKDRVRLGIDAAARDFFVPAEGLYGLGDTRRPFQTGAGDASELGAGQAQENGAPAAAGKLSSDELVQLYQELAEGYKLAFIVDPFDMEDFGNTTALSKLLEPQGVKILGGELLGGNVKRIAQAAASKCCHGQDLKLPFVGTLSDAIGSIRAARDADWTTSLSGSPGDSEDPLLADVAVGLGVQWLRVGPVFGSQHTAKLNRILAIEEQQEGHAVYLKPEPLEPGSQPAQQA